MIMMNERSASAYGMLVLLGVLCSAPVWAQAVNSTPSPRDQNYVLFGKKDKKDSDQLRALRGTVLDSAGSPVSGATVQLNEPPNGKGRSVTSGSDGSFRFDELSLKQDYHIQALYKGTSSPRRTISQFDTRKSVTVELRLEKRKGTAKP